MGKIATGFGKKFGTFSRPGRVRATESLGWSELMRWVKPASPGENRRTSRAERNLKIESEQDKAFRALCLFVEMEILVIVLRVGGLAQTKELGFLFGAREFDQKAAG